MNFNDFEYDESKIPSDVDERIQFFKDLENKFKTEILTNPNYREYLSQFDSKSVETFAMDFANYKRGLIEYFELYKSKAESSRDVRYQAKAEEVFNMISQKKLFNMQCLWRAEKIEIPEVKIGIHFEFWSKRIEDCPFLEPITLQELDIMKLYLASDSYCDPPWHIRWQDYDDLTSINENGDYEMMPEWYSFYDLHMGTNYLLNLPNIRGEKEEFYFEKNREKVNAFLQSQPQQEPVQYKPYLYSSRDSYGTFINTFENTFLQFLHKGFTNFHYGSDNPTSNQELEEIEHAINLLAEAEYPVIMPGGMNWKEAILKCAEQYINQIIIQELDFFWENRQMLHDLGIRKHFTDEELEAEYKEEGLVNMLSEFILDGREYAGEPRNLDF